MDDVQTEVTGAVDAPAGTAAIEVRLLPWRPRRRIADPGIDLSSLSSAADDLIGGVVALVVTVLAALLALVVVATVVVVLLELWIVGAIALLLLVARFAGLLPWAVHTGGGTYERYRWLPNAAARVRELNGTRHARFRWYWA